MLASVATSALAFNAPQLPAHAMARSSVSMQESLPLGATGPLGYWDPLGLSKGKPEKFARWRAVEIKHGRIAMMATLGYISQECFRFGGYLSASEKLAFADLPNGIQGFAAVPVLGKAQMLLFVALMEIVTWRFYDGTGPWDFKPRADKEPGDVAGDFWVRYADPEVKATKLNIELNNGRAAMLGITGMLCHDTITGSWIPPGL